MKKFTILFLCAIILFSAFAPTSIALAEEIVPPTYFNTGVSAQEQLYSDGAYYAFKNPYKIVSGASKIAVIEQPLTEDDFGSLLVFSATGQLLLSTPMLDPRDVEIIGNTCFVLDYSYSSDTTSIHAINLNDGTSSVLLTEPTVFDITTDGTNLFALCGVLSRRIEKYIYNGASLSLDENFNTGTIFANATMISASRDYIMAYQSNIGIQTITALSLVDSKRTDITSLPSGGVVEFDYIDNSLYILNSKGCYVGNLSSSPDFKPALLSKPTEHSNCNNIITPLSFCENTYNSGILILDGQNAMAVKAFYLSGDALLQNFFSISSFSADEGAFNTPKDVVHSNGKTYFADSKNHRIAIRTSNNKNQYIETVDTKNTLYSPNLLGVDYFGNVYVSTNKKIFKYSSSFKLLDEYTQSDNLTFTNITALYVSDFSDDVFLIDNDRLCKYDAESNSFKTIKNSQVASKVLCVDMRNELFLTVEDNVINAYDLNSFSKASSFKVGENNSYKIFDISVDYNGDLYVLTSFNNNCTINKYTRTVDGYSIAGTVYFSELINKEFISFSIDFEGNQLFLIPKEEHRIFNVGKTGYNSLGIKNLLDLKIPTNIFDHKQDKNALIGTILDAGNCILFPLNKTDELFPENYAITRTRKVPAGEKVVVAGYTQDEKFAYVIYNNTAAFMDATSISTNQQLEDVPYKYAVALHENVYVYKYPLTTVVNLKPLYDIEMLKKDTPLTVINRAGDYLSPSGLYWYYVSYINSKGQLAYGYIPRFNTVEDIEVYDPEYTYGQINAQVLKGFVDVFADFGNTPLGVKLLDKTKIRIIDDTNPNFVYIQEVKENDDGVVGYVNRENITLEVQTRSTTIALILIGVLILIIILLIVAKVVLNKIKRKQIK